MSENIEEIQAKIKELQNRLYKAQGFRRKYPHNCPFCGNSWFGQKEHIVSCTICKRRFDYVLQRNKQCRDACSKFDSLIRSKGEASKDYPAFHKKFTFKALGDGTIEFTKIENGTEKEKQIVATTYEILKSWEWREFLKNFEDLQ
jgi:predicted  nucleic acid-binding Zn-ribbon protein